MGVGREVTPQIDLDGRDGFHTAWSASEAIISSMNRSHSRMHEARLNLTTNHGGALALVGDWTCQRAEGA